MFSEADHAWMQRALELAKLAEAHQEVPVGALVVHQGHLIGEGWNSPIRHCDPSAHAEMLALRAAAKNRGNYRLCDTTLYVTLEPCLMCIGAITHARVQRVVFAAADPKVGAVAFLTQSEKVQSLNHQTDYQGGLMSHEAKQLLNEFFRSKRK